MDLLKLLDRMTPEDGLIFGASLVENFRRGMRGMRREIAVEPDEPKPEPRQSLVVSGSAFDAAGIGSAGAAALAGEDPDAYWGRVAAAREDARREAWARAERAKIEARRIIETEFRDSLSPYWIGELAARRLLRGEDADLSPSQLAVLDRG